MHPIIKSNALRLFSILTCCLLLPLQQGCSPVNKTGTPPAVTPEPTALDEPGEFAVSQFNTRMKNDIGTYSATLYHPANPGFYPAIAFSPGLGAQKEYYRWVGNHLASHGYIVLIFTVPIPLTGSTTQHQAGFVTAFDCQAAHDSHADHPRLSRRDLAERDLKGDALGRAAA